MKISEHFISEEFLPKEIHNYCLKKGINPQWYINENAVKFLEWLKTQVNDAPITINNWKYKGSRNWSGLRTWLFKWGGNFFETWANSLSQHRFKDAYDIQVEGFSPYQIVDIIKKNWDYISKEFHLTTVENPDHTPTWTHIDWRYSGFNYLLIVNP